MSSNARGFRGLDPPAEYSFAGFEIEKAIQELAVVPNRGSPEALFDLGEVHHHNIYLEFVLAVDEYEGDYCAFRSLFPA